MRPSLTKSHKARARAGLRNRPQKTISAAAIKIAERFFWQKRGFPTPPITSAGVMS